MENLCRGSYLSGLDGELSHHARHKVVVHVAVQQPRARVACTGHTHTRSTSASCSLEALAARAHALTARSGQSSGKARPPPEPPRRAQALAVGAELSGAHAAGQQGRGRGPARSPTAQDAPATMSATLAMDGMSDATVLALIVSACAHTHTRTRIHRHTRGVLVSPGWLPRWGPGRLPPSWAAGQVCSPRGAACRALAGAALVAWFWPWPCGAPQSLHDYGHMPASSCRAVCPRIVHTSVPCRTSTRVHAP